MYKVGDTVRIVSEDYMRSHFVPEGFNYFRTPGDLFINNRMLWYCGETVEISSIYDVDAGRYMVRGNAWVWDKHCFEAVEQFDFSGLEELL